MSLKDSIHHMSDRGSLRMLDALGLERKREPVDMVLPAVGIFGAGLVVGAALGLLFAPKPGAEIRHDIGDRYQGLKAKGRRALHRDNGDADGDHA